MAIEIKVVGFGTAPKNIAASNVYVQMGASALWYSSNSSTVSLNQVLSNANQDWLILQNNTYVDVKFTADSGASNGQGLIASSAFQEIKVAVIGAGTVKILRAQYVTAITSKTDAYSNGNAVTAQVDDILEPGDMIICSNNGSFVLEFTPWGLITGNFTAFPIVKMFLN